MLFLIPLVGPIAGTLLLPTAFSFCVNAYWYPPPLWPPSAIVGILLFGLIF
jgi:hypothetical protein